MDQKPSRKSVHPQLFARIKAILLDDGYCLPALGWPVLRTQFHDQNGSETKELTVDTTHIIAGTWLDVMHKWPWSIINRYVSDHSLQVVDHSWITDSIENQRLEDAEEHGIFECELVTTEWQKEEREWHV